MHVYINCKRIITFACRSPIEIKIVIKSNLKQYSILQNLKSDRCSILQNFKSDIQIEILHYRQHLDKKWWNITFASIRRKYLKFTINQFNINKYTISHMKRKRWTKCKNYLKYKHSEKITFRKVLSSSRKLSGLCSKT